MSDPATLAGRVALVTGASQGIGQAVARALATEGATVLALARRPEPLAELRDACGGDAVRPLPLDLTDGGTPDAAALAVEEAGGRLDVLVHCAGIIVHAEAAHADLDDLERLWSANVHGPYALTHRLLPFMRDGSDIVFVNSSVTRHPRAGSGQFAATMHAMVGIADSLRAELNDRGVRVLSVFPGKTATPRQANLHRAKGLDYRPEAILQPESIALSIIHAVSLPPTAEITELHIRPHAKG